MNKYVRLIERDEVTNMLENKNVNSATLSNIKRDLENLTEVALEKSDPDLSQMSENVRNIVKKNFDIASSMVRNSSSHERVSSANLSIQNLLLDENNSDNLETLIGSSLTAMIEYDKDHNFQVFLLRRTIDTFKQNLIGIPKDLRWQFWNQMLPIGKTAPLNVRMNLSSISKKVLEQFKHWAGLKFYNDINGNCQLLSIKILSQEEKFNRCKLFWMLPLLHASSDNLFIKIDDIDYHHKIMDKLNFMLENLRLNRHDIFTLVDSIFDTIQKVDSNYFEHICNISKDNLSEFESDFDEKMIGIGQKINTFHAINSLQSMVKVYVRMWLFHGFVTILSKNSLLFVWDFLFLHSWTIEAQKTVVLAIINLLRFWIMRANTGRRLRNVMMQEPSKIYLSDLRSMIKHLFNGGSITEGPQSTNYKKKTEAEITRNPKWDTIRFRRDSLVQKTKGLSFVELIDKISPKFKRKDSVSSVDSEETEKEPWLKLWIHCNMEFLNYFEKHPLDFSEPFDFYVDTIRYLPQNFVAASISVFMYDPKKSTMKPIAKDVLPDLASFSKLPNYNFKVHLNTDKSVGENSCLLFQIYGLEACQSSIVHLGSAKLELCKDGKLQQGGHQIPVKRLYKSKTLADFATDPDKFDKIPCLTLLVRLQKRSEHNKQALWYESGAYKNLGCEPTDTELLFYKTYFHEKDFLKNSLKKVIKDNNLTQENNISQFLKNKFEEKSEKNLNIIQFNQYNPEVGLKLTIERIYGLGSKWDTKYFQILTEIVDMNSPEKSLARVLSQNHKMKSMIRSPVWEDELSPFILASPENKLVILKMYSFKPEYKASWGKEPEGKMAGDLDIDSSKPDLWSVMPLMKSGDINVRSGLHFLPLFKGGPTQECFKKFRTSGCTSKTIKV